MARELIGLAADRSNLMAVVSEPYGEADLERELLKAAREGDEGAFAAREGDEGAFAALVEPRRGELQAHCYRMLGSLQDAEDALQEALLRAWRGLDGFAGRGSLRSWLYRIATNASLNAIEKRPKRVLPVDYGPAADPQSGPGEPLVESVWIEPLPEERLGLDAEIGGPEARYEQREAVELAFIAALQNLPANQRAVLILRDVLGFSAKEVAATLETSTAAVNSALQRARAGAEARLPEHSQQATLRSLGDDRLRTLVAAYAAAWERNDVDAVVELLTEDVSFAMPPLRTWFGGRQSVATFLAGFPLSGTWRWRTFETRANAQVALAFYTWDEEAANYQPFALNVLGFEGERVSDVTAFLIRSTEIADPEVLARLPEQPPDPDRLSAAFARFGLPTELGD